MTRSRSSRPGDERRARLLIPDNTPLSLLALVGEDALDLLFRPGVAVWVTDMVHEEAVREPGPGDDKRREHRGILKAWFERNADKIHIQETAEGLDYKRAMRVWEMAGSPPDLQPGWQNRGEKSIFETLGAVEAALSTGDTVIVVMDDRTARNVLRFGDYPIMPNMDLMATESFIRWMDESFGAADYNKIWLTISTASRDEPPAAPDEDPVLIRYI